MQNKKISKPEPAFEPRYCTEPGCPEPNRLFNNRRTLYNHRKSAHVVPKKRGVVRKFSDEEKKERRRALDKARADARRKARAGAPFKTKRPKRSDSEETTASRGLPLRKIKVFKPAFLAEPSDTIGSLPWRAPMMPVEALCEMGMEKFWHEAIENHYDPIWVYRYLRWRLGSPKLKGERALYDGIPSIKICIAATMTWLDRNLPESPDDEIGR